MFWFVTSEEFFFSVSRFISAGNSFVLTNLGTNGNNHDPLQQDEMVPLDSRKMTFDLRSLKWIPKEAYFCRPDRDYIQDRSEVHLGTFRVEWGLLTEGNLQRNEMPAFYMSNVCVKLWQVAVAHSRCPSSAQDIAFRKLQSFEAAADSNDLSGEVALGTCMIQRWKYSFHWRRMEHSQITLDLEHAPIWKFCELHIARQIISSLDQGVLFGQWFWADHWVVPRSRARRGMVIR